MGGKDDDDDDEGCVPCMKKVGSAVIHYGGSFLAVALAFVAFDTAKNSPPMKDPQGWIDEFKTNIWGGYASHAYSMLVACSIAAAASFTMEITCVMLDYGNLHKILKYVAIVNVVMITIFILPTVITGFVMAGRLSSIPPKEVKCDKLFGDFDKYEQLVKSEKEKNGDFDADISYNNTAKLQRQVDDIQFKYFCCGLNKWEDWVTLLHPNYTDLLNKTQSELEEIIPQGLHWWIQIKPNATRLPKSCCDGGMTNKGTKKEPKYEPKHEGACYDTSEHRARESCKGHLLGTLIRCIIFSSALLMCAGFLGILGAFCFFRSATKGMAVQERYNQWLIMSGQNEQGDDDQD